MAGRTAHITVKFVSEQISALYDAAGAVIEGDPNVTTEVTDFWTFARDTRSSDPNWTLVATGTAD
jgi:predicted lipid-binding transport protein (Tim44 family)